MYNNYHQLTSTFSGVASTSPLLELINIGFITKKCSCIASCRSINGSEGMYIGSFFVRETFWPFLSLIRYPYQQAAWRMIHLQEYPKNTLS